MFEFFIERCHEIILENYPDADLDNAILPMFIEGGIRVISASSTKSPKVYGDISVGSRAWMVGRLFPFKTESDRIGLNFRLIYVSAV